MTNPMVDLLNNLPEETILEYRDTLIEFALACAISEGRKIALEDKPGNSKSLLVCLTLRPMLESLLTKKRTDQPWILRARCEDYIERFFKEGKL